VIAIVDYGMGNLRSVEKALERVGCDAERTADHERIRAAEGIVLPGVGAFPRAMERIGELGLDTVTRERAEAGVPTLGICLGMQLLFSASTELGGAAGLDLVEGRVSAIDALPESGQKQVAPLKVPHIGWSPVSWSKPSRLTEGLADAEPFYFVHSFVPRPAEAADTLGTATYGERFTCAVERGNVYGVQFHPEKSSGAGLRLLRNFAAVCSAVLA